MSEDLRMAAGTTYQLQVSTLEGIELTSSNPAVIDVGLAAADKTVVVTAANAGSTTLTARCVETGEVVRTSRVYAVPVASIDLHYRGAPGVDEPITTVAGLLGGVDSIGVIYRDNRGLRLSGTGQFAVRGTTVALAPARPRRLTDSLLQTSTDVDLEFLSLGTAELVASVAGGIERVLPIEVVAGPATVGLVAAALSGWTLVPEPTTAWSRVYLVTAVTAKTADGRYLSGVDAAWEITPNLAPSALAQGTTEIMVQVSGPGPAAITATIGDLMVTREFAEE